MGIIDNKAREHAVTYTIESCFCMVGSPIHEFIIIAFYDEGAGFGGCA